MAEKLIPIASEESYHTEDNCSGTLYLIPKHFLLDEVEKCWRSNSLVKENEIVITDTGYGEYWCGCGQIFTVNIKDRFGE